MYKHSFIYTIVEDHIDIDATTKKLIKNIKLTKDVIRPEMNLTSFYQNNDDLNNLIINKLGVIFEKLNLVLSHCWIQKYLKNSYHSVHTHNPKGKSFVWFIEGNKDSSPLCFYDVGYPSVDINENITCEFVPGKLIIFPGFIPHEVRPNKNNNRLIVSGNLNELQSNR
jgi:hypothetical protein